MKIRNTPIIHLLAFLGAWLIRVYMSTICFRFRHLGPIVDPRLPGMKEGYIYAFFHEYILLPTYAFASPKIHVLISQHADGELIARICRHLGFGTIRGSSTRGGIKALRKMMRASRHSHIAVIPDGPRGPRRHVEPGMIYLAARTGLPIMLVGIAYRNPWRLGTWDRFAIPRPFSEVLALSADPILVPPNLSRDELESCRLEVEARMRRITERAEYVANR